MNKFTSIFFSPPNESRSHGRDLEEKKSLKISDFQIKITYTHKSQKYFLNLMNMDSRITQSTHLTYESENYFSKIKYNAVI